MFVWTFEGVMQAAFMGFILLWIIFFGVISLVEKIKDKFKKD